MEEFPEYWNVVSLCYTSDSEFKVLVASAAIYRLEECCRGCRMQYTEVYQLVLR